MFVGLIKKNNKNNTWSGENQTWTWGYVFNWSRRLSDTKLKFKDLLEIIFEYVD